MTQRTFLTTILLSLAAVSAPLAQGAEEQYFTIQLEDANISSTAPVEVSAGQSMLATVWHFDENPVLVSAIDAETGETLGEVETKPDYSYKVAVKFPWIPASTRYVLFQAEGKPIRARASVQLRVIDGPLTSESLRSSWGRTFEFGASEKPQHSTTEPMVLTEAHTLALQLFNRGGRAAVTVRGWDYVTKRQVEGVTQIVEGRRGTRIEIPGAVAQGMAQLVQGRTANGLMQLEVIIEPLDGPADLVMTAEAHSAFGNITLKRGYISNDEIWSWR